MRQTVQLNHRDRVGSPRVRPGSPFAFAFAFAYAYAYAYALARACVYTHTRVSTAH